MVMKASLSLIASRVARRATEDAEDRKMIRAFIQNLELTTFEDGNFTIVTLSRGNEVIGAGASKKNNADVYDEGIGFNLALVRAAEVAAQEALVHREHYVLPESAVKKLMTSKQEFRA